MCWILSHKPFKWILRQGNDLTGPLRRLQEPKQCGETSCSAKSLTGVCLPGACLHSQQIIPFWYLHASARKPDATRVIRIRVACSLPDKSHLDTRPAMGRKSVWVTRAALRRDGSSWWSCPLRQKKTLACLQLLWFPFWPPVMGWIWSSFKNVVPFFT